MKQFIIFLFVLIFSFSQVSAQELKQKIEDANTEIENYQSKIAILKQEKKQLQLAYIRERLKMYALPKMTNEEELIEHQALMLVYSEQHEQAKWVAHIISTEIANGGVSRTNDFRIDPKIKTGSAVQEDYFYKYEQGGEVAYNGLGYDRGHLAPSADFRWSKEALSESYFYSNMSPQLGDFNREGWAKLEGMLRAYVYTSEVDLYVITAPILNDDLKVINEGVNKVSIPEYFYKIAYDIENQKAIAFLAPNKKLEHTLSHYVVSIDSIENITGIDFFHKLPDDIENDIENQTDFMYFVSNLRNIQVEPITNLEKNQINTTQLKGHVNSDKKVTVCGTIVATKKHAKGHVFMNMDKTFPNQPLSITIWASNVINFSYEPEIELLNKRVCIKAKIGEYNGVPNMIIDNEKQIEFLDENK